MALRIGFVTGVLPDKWWRRWRDSHPEHDLHPEALSETAAGAGVMDGSLDGSLLRLDLLPEHAALRRVRLYTEDPVVLVARDHLLTAAEPVDAAALAEFEPLAAFGALEEHAEVLASGAGYQVVPASIARALSHPKLRALHVSDELAEHSAFRSGLGLEVGFAFLAERDADDIQDLIGVLRGRRTGSSRQQVPAQPEKSVEKSVQGAGGSRRGRGRGPVRPAQRSAGRGARPRRRR